MLSLLHHDYLTSLRFHVHFFHLQTLPLHHPVASCPESRLHGKADFARCCRGPEAVVLALRFRCLFVCGFQRRFNRYFARVLVRATDQPILSHSACFDSGYMNLRQSRRSSDKFLILSKRKWISDPEVPELCLCFAREIQEWRIVWEITSGYVSVFKRWFDSGYRSYVSLLQLWHSFIYFPRASGLCGIGKMTSETCLRIQRCDWFNFGHTYLRQSTEPSENFA